MMSEVVSSGNAPETKKKKPQTNQNAETQDLL